MKGHDGAAHSRLWFFTTATSIAVGIAPIWILETFFGVSRKISVGYGILAWIIGVTLVKVPLHHFIVERPLRARLSARQLAVSAGLLSAVSELGVALAFFTFVIPKLSFWQVVGFGVGAGAVEAVILPFMSNPLKGTTLEEHASEAYCVSQGVATVQWLGVLERVLAMLLHVGARGLVYLSTLIGNPLPALIGVGGFAVVDGVVYYGHLSKWRFDSPRVLWRVHAFIAAMASLILGTFVLWATQSGLRAG